MNASLETFIIQVANLNVDIVSSIWSGSGHTFAIINVLQFPPIESFKIFVSFDCLYGTWVLYLSHTATTTYSRKLRDLLMNWASFSVIPSEFVFLVLSLPARSTKWSFDIITFSLDSTQDFDSKWIVNMQWDQELALFSLCYEIVLFVSPSNR